MFCEQENKPLLRFPQYKEEWKIVKLKEVVSRINRKNKNGQTQRALTIAAQFGLVDQTAFFNKQIASVDLSNYYLLFKGEFAYNRSYSKGYPLGAVKRLDLYESGTLSTLYICFKPLDKMNSDYLLHYFESSKWHRGVLEIAGEGARNHGLLNVPLEDYFSTSHYIPSNEEQEKIATFLNLYSRKINAKQKKLNYFEKQKQYLLKQMFI